MATQSVLAISSEAEFASKISSIPASTLAVLYFHAPWAAPCKQMSVVLDTLAATYPADAPVIFLSIPAEDLPETSEQYDVTAVPLVVLQRAGSVLEPISGSDAAKVRAAVEKHVGAGSANGSSPAGAALPPAQNVTKPAVPAEAAAAPPSNGAASAPERDLVGGKGEPLAPELYERLDGLVKAAPVMLFMKGTPSAPQCGFSRKTVGLLREKQIRYGFFNILADQDVREGLKKYADWPTYPQLWVDGDLVGGLDIVTEEFENDPGFLDQYSVAAKTEDASASATVEASA